MQVIRHRMAWLVHLKSAMKRALLVLLCGLAFVSLAALGACGSDSPAGPSVPAVPTTPNGSYTITTVNGKALPVALFAEAAVRGFASIGACKRSIARGDN